MLALLLPGRKTANKACNTAFIKPSLVEAPRHWLLVLLLLLVRLLAAALALQCWTERAGAAAASCVIRCRHSAALPQECSHLRKECRKGPVGYTQTMSDKQSAAQQLRHAVGSIGSTGATRHTATLSQTSFTD
jgi:hypothetical protein